MLVTFLLSKPTHFNLCESLLLSEPKKWEDNIALGLGFYVNLAEVHVLVL